VRFAIVGAGATGGYLGAHLARSGVEVVLVARGAHLEAMRTRGLTVREAGEEFTVAPNVSDDLAAGVGAADCVFVTLKAHQLPAVAASIGAALRPGAFIVSAQNGIPWWYFPDRSLESVDPGGTVLRAIPYDRVVGCVVYPATRLSAPGVVEHVEGTRFSIGEPAGPASERAEAVVAALRAAGLKSSYNPRIRNEIWLKLIGNATLNPVAALTRATLVEVVRSPETGPLVRELMEEAAAVARASGAELEASIERRLEGAARVGDHKPSTLQDLEAGKPLELDALSGAVVELAAIYGVAVPRLAAVHGLAKLLDRINRQQLSS
jgi:2-dehydropantoate 2-reductase